MGRTDRAHRRCRWRAASLLAASALGVACQGQLVPLSAQQGSTVLIPLQSEAGAASAMVGYGGAEVIDYQRGELRFRLDGSTGPVLVTRGVSTVTPSPASLVARGGSILSGGQLVAIVDLPVDAPLGTHALHVSRVRIENQQEVEYPSSLQHPGFIKVLPNQIQVNLPGGGSEVITGAGTPFQAYLAFLGGWLPIGSDYVPTAVPDPQVKIVLNQAIWAGEFTITYPEDVIDVEDVLEPPFARSNRLASAWFEGLPPQGTTGSIVVKMVGGASAFQTLSVVFTLDDGSQEILDASDVVVTVDKAFDYAGSPVSVNVASKSIQ